MTLNIQQKSFVLIVFFIISVSGFMLKLPPVFRHIDKELHAAFYFCAAALLNFLFVRRSLPRHVAVFTALLLFGVAIEYAQDYSNRFFHQRIHGRFDPEDIKWNVKGLIAFSLCWLTVAGLIAVYKKPVSN